MRELIGKNVCVFYVETNGKTFKKEGVVVSVNEGLLYLREKIDGDIVIPISRIGKFEVM